MIPLLVTGLALAAGLSGLALLALWARRHLLRVRLGGLDPRCLEVMARVGLHANQGLALVRVGRRILLVSSGEGGARMLAELSEDDLRIDEHGAAVSEPDGSDPEARAAQGVGSGSFGLRLHEALQSVRRTGTALVLGATLLSAAAVTPASAGAFQVDSSEPATPGVVAPGTRGSDGQLGSIFEALPRMSMQVGDEGEGLKLNGTVGTVLVLGLLSLAPTLLLLTTAFTRILIVLHLLRQALGTQATPPGHLLAGLALLLTGAVMAPTLQEVRVLAVDPWLAGEIEESVALGRAASPVRDWMLTHTRENDLRTFLQISRSPQPLTADDIPMTVLMSAYVTSELRTAFEIGFAIFLPFIVIDLVVAAVLTSMGMFMLPPTMIALPCKLMLFVLMDGWTLLVGALAESFL